MYLGYGTVRIAVYRHSWDYRNNAAEDGGIRTTLAF